MEYERSTNTMQSLQYLLSNRNLRNVYSDLQHVTTRREENEDLHSLKQVGKPRQSIQVKVGQDAGPRDARDTESLELPLN